MLNKQLLNVKDLYVDVEDKEILHGVDLSIGEGETHVLMGPNGTGKSTFGYALMGNPRYTVKSGEIWFKGKNIRRNQSMSVPKTVFFFLSRIRLRFQA